MQFDHVHLYMAFGSAVALAGFVLALFAKSGDGHGTFKILGAEISLQAAGGILVIAIGALIFLAPMMMGRDLNQQVEIDRLEGELSEARAQLDEVNAALGSKTPIEDLSFTSASIAYPYEEPISACARKIAASSEYSTDESAESGIAIVNYGNGIAYFHCSSEVTIVAVSQDPNSAGTILGAATGTVSAIYPRGADEAASQGAAADTDGALD